MTPREPLILESEERELVHRKQEAILQLIWDLLRRVKSTGGWDDALMRERDELHEFIVGLDSERAGSDRVIAEIDAAESQRLTQQAAGSWSSPAHKPGRPGKYSLAQLQLVAKTYRRRFMEGSRSPTRDVAELLNIPHSSTAKLVMRCRDPRVGLLGLTKPREAGGTEPPTPEDKEEP